MAAPVAVVGQAIQVPRTANVGFLADEAASERDELR